MTTRAISNLYLPSHTITGKDAAAEDGHPVQYEHLPATGAGPYAEGADSRALHSAGPAPGH